LAPIDDSKRYLDGISWWLTQLLKSLDVSEGTELDAKLVAYIVTKRRPQIERRNLQQSQWLWTVICR
jgi:hypothetical protein